MGGATTGRAPNGEFGTVLTFDTPEEEDWRQQARKQPPPKPKREDDDAGK